MKNQYVGDIGDYIKYALLRAVMKAEPDKKLGVAWYLTGKDNTTHGSHIDYLDSPEKWDCLDKDVFDCLKKLVFDNMRSVEAVKKSGLLKGAKFFSEKLQAGTDGAESRDKWFKQLQERLESCDIIFADPDIGLKNPSSKTPLSETHITLQEAAKLVKKRKRIGIFYHHYNHSESHKMQLQKWRTRLKHECNAEVVALHWRAYSSRAFFIVNPTHAIKNALKELEAKKIKNSGGKPAIEICGFNE